MSGGGYRPVPSDRDKTGPAEVTMCSRCSWSDNTKPHYCFGPPNPTGLTVWAHKVPGAPEGECAYFRPSALTRIARRVGLRRPVMR